MELDLEVETELRKWLENKFHFSVSSQEIILGNGVAPLFASIAHYCYLNNIVILFPRGVYGYFMASALFHKAEVICVPTKEELGFKFTQTELEEIFANNKNQKYAVFLNAPVVNPTGQIYKNEELSQIVHTCNHRGALVILDTIFSGLQYESMNASEQSVLGTHGFSNTVLLGGVSKEHAAAGLRLGYAATKIPALQHFIKQGQHLPLPRALKYTFKKLFYHLNNTEINIVVHLKKQRENLKERANKLSIVLKRCGWTPLSPCGGLFMVAKPEGLLGKYVVLPGSVVKSEITYENVHDLLFTCTGLLINSSAWCGIPQYCRFVLSVKEEEFQEACLRLEKFFELTKAN